METKAPELKYCLYARKSSESDERQAMSIDSQLTEMRLLAESEHLEVVVEKQESFSAKESGKRPVYNEILDGLRNGEYNAVLTWAPDRLSRNAGDLGSIVDLMDQGKLLHIRTYSQTFTNNPNEKFLLMILCSQAKLENDNKSVNVLRGIKTKCEMGWRPGVAPLGYINRHFGGVKDIIPDPERAEIVTEMFNKAAYERWSGRRLKNWLDGQGFTNRSGKHITLSQVYLILTNPFYFGEFEYPEGSGKWFKGAHKPLISKELFEQIQQTRGANKGIWGSKTFAFRGLMKCGNWGADITAEEHFKKLKNGEFNRHVYYRCTKRVDPNCPGRYITEQNLSDLLQEFIEQHLDEIRTSSKLQAKIEKHYGITKTLFEYHNVGKKLEEPIVEYTRYVLTRGGYTEKINLIKGIHNKLSLKAGQLAFIK